MKRWKKKDQENKQKGKISDLGRTIAMITLNVNNLNTQIKNQRSAELVKNTTKDYSVNMKVTLNLIM